MKAPFFIACLPRSRSAWLSKFLSYGSLVCGHDMAVDAESMVNLFDRLRSVNGTVETAGMLAWQDVRRNQPGTQIIVVRRCIEDVIASLRAKDFPFDEAELRDRAAMLDAMSETPGIMTVRYEALSTEYACAWLFEHCTGMRFDRYWWERLSSINVQIDLEKRLDHLMASHERIEALKAEFVPSPVHTRRTVIATEPWGSIWPECGALAAQHLLEVDGGTAERHRGIDHLAIANADLLGAMRIVSARRDGRLVGYLTWTKTTDPESMGLRIANQGGWYVADGCAPSPAVAMFDRSIKELHLDGIQMAYPHHRIEGRGANIGKFFARRGATHIQQGYEMRIGAV